MSGRGLTAVNAGLAHSRLFACRRTFGPLSQTYHLYVHVGEPDESIHDRDSKTCGDIACMS